MSETPRETLESERDQTMAALQEIENAITAVLATVEALVNHPMTLPQTREGIAQAQAGLRTAQIGLAMALYDDDRKLAKMTSNGE